MNRRRLLIGALGVALAGCARSPGRTGGSPVALPSGENARAAALTVSGGFLPLGYQELTAPRLAVYADGTAVADADRLLTLSRQETTDLVAALRRDLSRAGASPSPGGSVQVADAGTTQLWVAGADGTPVSVTAYALDVLDYPQPVEAAGDRLAQLATRVRDSGQPYTSPRVRLVAVPGPDGGTAPAWPAGVPVPAPRDGGLVRLGDLSGAEAAAAMSAFRRGTGGGSWSLVATPDAGNLAVAWRYLLPDE